MLFNFGAYMTPQVAYLQTLGLETLSARYHVQASNALTLAKRLHDTEGIKSVNYVGLDDNPFHELAQKQFGPTAGAMVCIDLESQEACFRMLNNLSLSTAPQTSSTVVRSPSILTQPSTATSLRSRGRQWMFTTPPSA